MKSSFNFTVYAEPQNEEVPQIKVFNKEEWGIIFDLFLRLSKKFKSEYKEINDIEILDNKNSIKITIDKDIISAEEIEYFSDVLMGYESDNIIAFDNINYIMRGLLTDGEENINEEDKMDIEENSFLNKMNSLTLKDMRNKK